METHNDKESITRTFDSKLDRLLSKYVGVWLWSIILAGATGLTYEFYQFRYFSESGPLLLIITPLMIIAGVKLVVCWFSLFHYLKNYLVPVFLTKESISDDVLSNAGKKLIKAFYALVITSIIFLASYILLTIFSFLR